MLLCDLRELVIVRGRCKLSRIYESAYLSPQTPTQLWLTLVVGAILFGELCCGPPFPPFRSPVPLVYRVALHLMPPNGGVALLPD